MYPWAVSPALLYFLAISAISLGNTHFFIRRIQFVVVITLKIIVARDGSAVKSVLCFPEDPSSVLSTYARQLTVVYHPGPEHLTPFFWPSSAPTHMHIIF